MTIGLPAGLVARLSRSRLHARWARPEVGIGERGSRAIGSGIEFAEHRPYQPGDDLRHLDRHAYARFGQPYVKQYTADRGLDVRLLLDKSASMAQGDPSKVALATTLAVGTACLVLAAGDRLRVGTFAGGATIEWQPPLTGFGRLPDAAAWLRRPQGEGVTDLAGAAARNRERLEGRGLTIVMSDWWTQDPAEAVRAFARGGAEVVVVHVLAPEEEEPDWEDDEAIRLQDAETGEIVDLTFDAAARERYLASLSAWRDDLRSAVAAAQGRYLPVRSDAPPERVLLRDWRRAGLVT